MTTITLYIIWIYYEIFSLNKIQISLSIMHLEISGALKIFYSNWSKQFSSKEKQSISQLLKLSIDPIG